jgi:chromosome segregation ATPase
MSDFSKFRSSLGGFNRSDVANYIESNAIEHQKELHQLKDEAEKLTAEKNALAIDLVAAKGEVKSLRDENASLREQLDALRAEADKAVQAAAAEQAAPEEAAAPEETAEPAQAQSEEEARKQDLDAMELAAYRRAEAAERNAAVRARKLREQLSELLERSRSRCSDSGEELDALTDDLTGNLDRLKETIAELRLVFDETQDAFDALEVPDVPDDAE